jgi:hypothetical protein
MQPNVVSANHHNVEHARRFRDPFTPRLTM